MVSVNVAELKAKLSHYLKVSEEEGPVLITSHGRVVARIVPEKKSPPKIDWLEFFTQNPPVKLQGSEPIPTSELIRQMRDEEL